MDLLGKILHILGAKAWDLKLLMTTGKRGFQDSVPERNLSFYLFFVVCFATNRLFLFFFYFTDAKLRSNFFIKLPFSLRACKQKKQQQKTYILGGFHEQPIVIKWSWYTYCAQRKKSVFFVWLYIFQLRTSRSFFLLLLSVDTLH